MSSDSSGEHAVPTSQDLSSDQDSDSSNVEEVVPLHSDDYRLAHLPDRCLRGRVSNGHQDGYTAAQVFCVRTAVLASHGWQRAQLAKA